MPDALYRVLSIAREKSWCIQIHTGNRGDVNENQISGYLPFCKKFSTVKFDLAHGKPFDELNQAVNEHDNIYVDCAYCTVDVVQQWLDNGAREERILFGSDIPVQQRLLDISLISYLRSILKNFSSEMILSHNFQKFLCKK